MVISAEQIESRKAALLGDDDWTDATQSVADGEDDDILVVDDDIMQAMDESDEDEEG